MMRFALIIGACIALTGCNEPPAAAYQPTGTELPPIGLAATARWLEAREAAVPALRLPAAAPQSGSHRTTDDAIVESWSEPEGFTCAPGVKSCQPELIGS